jgi:hypothetical protein
MLGIEIPRGGETDLLYIWITAEIQLKKVESSSVFLLVSSAN